MWAVMPSLALSDLILDPHGGSVRKLRILVHTNNTAKYVRTATLQANN